MTKTIGYKQARLRLRQQANSEWRGGDRRRFKKFMHKNEMDHPVYLAYCEGQALAELGWKAMPKRLRQNPYPPGRRRVAWEQGYK